MLTRSRLSAGAKTTGFSAMMGMPLCIFLTAKTPRPLSSVCRISYISAMVDGVKSSRAVMDIHRGRGLGYKTVLADNVVQKDERRQTTAKLGRKDPRKQQATVR